MVDPLVILFLGEMAKPRHKLRFLSTNCPILGNAAAFRALTRAKPFPFRSGFCEFDRTGSGHLHPSDDKQRIVD